MYRHFLAIALLASAAPLAAEVPGRFQLSPEVTAAILATPQGHTVEVPGFEPESFNKLAYVRTDSTDVQYIISDDPEYIRVPEAVAVREHVTPGTVRLYVYNVNGIKEPAKIDRRINAVIRNKSDQPLTVKFVSYATHPPTTDYFAVAKHNLRAFQEKTPGPDFVVPPNGSAPLDPVMEQKVVKFDELVHGWYEFTIDQPAVISVVQTDLETPSNVASDRITEVIPMKSKSGAGRGLFMNANLSVRLKDNLVVDTAHGPLQLTVADGKQDPWVTGREYTSGMDATLKGNYGVIYDIEFERSSTDGRGLAIVTWNARGGAQWCDAMANVIRLSAGIHPAGLVDVPTNKLNTRRYPEMVVLQVFPPLPAGETETVSITYSPPGASCLPTPFILLPIDVAK
jgi:hypothetical protein